MNISLSNGKLLGVLGSVVAVAAVTASIWLNPPSEVRAHNLDQVRLQGLKQTDNAIQAYYGAHHSLPVELNILDNESYRLMQTNWHDPETQHPYEYAITGAISYRLCAVFARDSDKQDNTYDYAFRKHSAGRDCFEQNVILHETNK